MSAIGTGDENWLAIGIALRSGTDAGASSTLHDAMFEALEKNPEYVLAHVEPTFPISTLCSGRHDPPVTYLAAAKELERVRASVQEINREELTLKKTQCLTAIDGAMHAIKDFFEQK